MEKNVKKYSKIYRKALTENKVSDVEVRVRSFEQRLAKMYASSVFTEHNIYPAMNVAMVYAVIAMCLELKEYGYGHNEIISFVNSAFENVKRHLDFCIKL